MKHRNLGMTKVSDRNSDTNMEVSSDNQSYMGDAE
jgi:hypothetical protein